MDSIIEGLGEFKEFLSSDADRILLANIKSLKSVIKRRIESGKDAKGNEFGKYSDRKINPYVFRGIDKPAQARNFVNKAQKNRTAISYKEIRESAGLKTSSKNFFFTGDMMASIAEEITEESAGKYEITIQPNSRKQIDKLISNENRDGEILGASTEEINNLTEDIEDEFLEVFIKVVK